MVVKIQVKVFWVVTLCSVVVGYRSFGGPSCFRLHPEYGGNIVSETLISSYNTT
jgi:hypothetical protein